MISTSVISHTEHAQLDWRAACGCLFRVKNVTRRVNVTSWMGHEYKALLFKIHLVFIKEPTKHYII